MNDWYLDPPEFDEGPECPECEDGLGDWVGTWPGGEIFECDCCGHQWQIALEPDYYEPDIPQLTEAELEEHTKAIAEANRLCPHGREWSECNACMVAGDLAYDAARERRFR